MRKQHLLFLLLAFLLVGCGTFGIESRVMQPAEATATAQAAPTPIPTLSLGKLAYVQGGDIWIKTLPDGEPRRLTTDGRNREPRWSPSGQWLALRKGDYQVCAMRADGSAGRPLNDSAAVGAFAWAPGTDRLAYVTAQGDLMAVNADGSNQRQLVAGVEGKGVPAVQRMAWSPDGKWLAYDRQEALKKVQPGQPPELNVGLWRIRADGSDATELYTAGAPAQDGIVVAGWSKDSRYIFFWLDPYFSGSILADGVPLHIIPASGGEPHQLDQDMLLYPDFWANSPMGKFLAITEGGGRETWSHKRIAIVDLSSGKLDCLTESEVAAFSPAWPPDGQRIAYIAAPDIGFVGGGDVAKAGAAWRRIWVMNSDGSDKHQLTHDAVYRDERPLWSADGGHLLFARMDADGRASLWLIPATGDEPEQIVDELTPAPEWFGYYGHVDWNILFDWWYGPDPETKELQSTSTSPIPPNTPPSSPSEIITTTLFYRQGQALYAWHQASGQVTELDLGEKVRVVGWASVRTLPASGN
jgi:Tol biopolymer transport system component